MTHRVVHVIFPRADSVRPLPEFVKAAAEEVKKAKDLDVELIAPVVSSAFRSVHNIARRLRGAASWPPETESFLRAIGATIVPYLPIPRRGVESAATAVLMQLLMRRDRPRVIHGSFLDEGGYVATTVARRLNCRSIVVAHGSDVRAARGQLRRQIGRRRRSLSSLRQADRVIAVSRFLAQELALLGVRAEVLPYTASAERFPLKPDRATDPVLLFVGRISREKGVDLLLRAFTRCHHPEARLWLVGPKADIDVETECERVGLSRDRVRVFGVLAQETLPEVYQKSSCLVLPSRAEGLPCVIAESLLTGRPVVASDVGGISELVDDQVGRLVPPEDIDALAQSINEVLRTREQFDPDHLRQRVLPICFESVGARLAELTRDLAS